MRTFALTGFASLGLTLAACDGATGDAAPPAAATPETSAPAATSTPMPSGEAQPITAIPAAMQGRWGMTTADCDPDEAANKGLMTVDATTLRFYESVAEIGDATLAGDTMLRGTFAYEGEGMQWTRDLTLSLSGADTLTLEELGDDAVEGPRLYTRCA
ncbi:hypothetical protein GRI62_10470 [Erythrobacter arachoides]|uniref:Lipocalin-like domain-containing protein n=1 Tax=Aurantiacibacter arachoides TaxID=1850444 RepID=A0A845A2U6_9SPHN|nr:hypothetical protein [Aurantiacibacter arachoides]MXO94024.1 hypothetical protein [Aurantiacibacter arachoides]